MAKKTSGNGLTSLILASYNNERELTYRTSCLSLKSLSWTRKRFVSAGGSHETTALLNGREDVFQKIGKFGKVLHQDKLSSRTDIGFSSYFTA